MKKHGLLFYIFSMVIAISVFGCGEHKLTRTEAETAIKKKINLPEGEYKEFKNTALKISGTIAEYYDSRPPFTNIKNELPKSELFSYLENNGLITITTKGDTSWSNLIYTGYRVDYFDEYYIANFTEKAGPFVNGNSVKIATIEFGEVTGIVERKEANISEVQYTTRRTNITPFGNAFNVGEETFNHTATFTKYDDGWRINN